MLRRPYSILPQRMELPPRFMRSVCRSPIWTKPPRRRSNCLIGIRAPSSGMRFGNSWTTPITDAGLLERKASMTSIIAVNDRSRGEIFPELTRDVIDRMKDAESPRLREILELVVSQVHAIVREAKITHDEWWQAIVFLTRAGQMCSDSRQEFILLSDILGISMLVDAIDHVGGSGLSESTVLGPFYAGQQRGLASGESILLPHHQSHPLATHCRVTDSQCRPIANALVEV